MNGQNLGTDQFKIDWHPGARHQAQFDEYAAFSKKFDLPEQRERIYYDLRDRVAPSQHTYKKWQANRQREPLNVQQQRSARQNG